MIDDKDADTLNEAYWQVMKTLKLLESITTDDDALAEPYEHLEEAMYRMAAMLEAYDEEQKKHWDTPLGDY